MTVRADRGLARRPGPRRRCPGHSVNWPRSRRMWPGLDRPSPTIPSHRYPVRCSDRGYRRAPPLPSPDRRCLPRCRCRPGSGRRCRHPFPRRCRHCRPSHRPHPCRRLSLHCCPHRRRSRCRSRPLRLPRRSHHPFPSLHPFRPCRPHRIPRQSHRSNRPRRLCQRQRQPRHPRQLRSPPPVPAAPPDAARTCSGPATGARAHHPRRPRSRRRRPPHHRAAPPPVPPPAPAAPPALAPPPVPPPAPAAPPALAPPPVPPPAPAAPPALAPPPVPPPAPAAPPALAAAGPATGARRTARARAASGPATGARRTTRARAASGPATGARGTARARAASGPARRPPHHPRSRRPGPATGARRTTRARAAGPATGARRTTRARAAPVPPPAPAAPPALAPPRSRHRRPPHHPRPRRPGPATGARRTTRARAAGPATGARTPRRTAHSGARRTAAAPPLRSRHRRAAPPAPPTADRQPGTLRRPYPAAASPTRRPGSAAATRSALVALRESLVESEVQKGLRERGGMMTTPTAVTKARTDCQQAGLPRPRRIDRRSRRGVWRVGVLMPSIRATAVPPCAAGSGSSVARLWRSRAPNYQLVDTCGRNAVLLHGLHDEPSPRRQDGGCWLAQATAPAPDHLLQRECRATVPRTLVGTGIEVSVASAMLFHVPNMNHVLNINVVPSRRPRLIVADGLHGSRVGLVDIRRSISARPPATSNPVVRARRLGVKQATPHSRELSLHDRVQPKSA